MIQTNLLKNSSSFNGWNHYRINLNADQSAPDGTNSAFQITPTYTIGQHFLSTEGVDAGNVLSIFVQNSRYNLFGLGQGILGTSCAIFDLENHIVKSVEGGTALIEPLGLGWSRVAFISNNISSEYYIWPNGNLGNYSGGSPINIWGPQLETGSKPTSYAPFILV